MIRIFTAVAAIHTLLASPVLAEVELVAVEDQPHFAEIWLHNAWTKGANEERHVFEIDGLPMVVINRHTPNMRSDAADFLFIESLPPHVQADQLEIAVEEGESGVIRLFWLVMG